MRSSNERSYERISIADLRRLGRLAEKDLAEFYKRCPDTARLYRNRLFAVALCQGAALHFIDGKNGVKDFDVWCFFRAHPSRPFPYRRVGAQDFGIPKFGRTPGCIDAMVGRHVDIIGRSLDVPTNCDPAETLRTYLASGRTASARHLALKAVVLIHPYELLGQIIWRPAAR